MAGLSPIRISSRLLSAMQPHHAVAQILPLEKALDGDGDFFQLERLGDIVKGAELHRFDGR